MQRGNTATIQLTPAHVGADGNEIAVLWAKVVAESVVYAVEKPLLNEISLA